jgi:hypothetical protein
MRDVVADKYRAERCGDADDAAGGEGAHRGRRLDRRAAVGMTSLDGGHVAVLLKRPSTMGS